MTGTDIRAERIKLGLSQAKLSELTGIERAKMSAYELGKIVLLSSEIESIKTCLESLDLHQVNSIRKKRYTKNSSIDSSIVNQRPRRSYIKTDRNDDYLFLLKNLESKFASPKKTKLKAASFFAGCGGLCYGVKAAGFEIVATNELEDDYKRIYKENFPEANFLSNDIKDVDKQSLDELVKKYGKIDLMVGGPPCQGFSLAGKRDVNDSRNTLFSNYLKIAEHLKPKVILMENVRLLTSMKDPNGQYVSRRVIDTLESIGYKSAFFNVNAKDYGVPQHRERVIFIGVRNDLKKEPIIPKRIYGESTDLFDNLKPYFTFGDAVSDLVYLESGEKCSVDKNHWAVKHPEHVIRWLVDVPEGRSAHDNEDESLRPPSGYNTTYKRQVWNEPAGTVATTYGMISGCRNVHPIATRALTTREALRLQSFPDNFKLIGNEGTIRTVIGNAVPPLLAYELAYFILKNYML